MAISHSDADRLAAIRGVVVLGLPVDAADAALLLELLDEAVAQLRTLTGERASDGNRAPEIVHARSSRRRIPESHRPGWNQGNAKTKARNRTLNRQADRELEQLGLVGTSSKATGGARGGA